MQGGRSNTGKVSVGLSGRNATKLASASQQQARTYKPNEYGAADVPDAGPKPVPQPQVTRPQAATPNVPRSGSRVVAAVGSAGLTAAGTVTGTPAEPVQEVAPALGNANSQ